MFLKIHNFLTNVQKATTRGWKLLTHIHDQQPDCDIMLRLNYPLSRIGGWGSREWTVVHVFTGCLYVLQADLRYEMTTSVKAQAKFLEELDSLERKRHEEEQRGVLLRAAKVDSVFSQVFLSRVLSAWRFDQSFSCALCIVNNDDDSGHSRHLICCWLTGIRNFSRVQ